MEKNNNASEMLLKAIIESAVDGIITINTRGLILSINPAACRIFGYEPNELEGLNISCLMPEPDKSSHNKYISNYLSSGEAKIIGIGREVLGKRKDGTLFPFKLSISEVVFGSEKIFAGIIHDMTALKTAEEKVAQLSREKELNELKSRFVSIASHEFRTPLATILSSVSLIAKYNRPDDEQNRLKHITRIKQNVGNLTSILNDFISLSKLEEGIISIAYQYFSVPEFCKDLTDELQGITKAGQIINYTHSGTRIDVWQDRQILRNILFNLLSNAIKYSDENKNIYFISYTTEKELFIEVKDEGIGIPKSDEHLLFERFFRANNAINIQGTGLGLNIVKKYLDTLGGEISFISEENIGTTFKIKLPIKD